MESKLQTVLTLNEVFLQLYFYFYQPELGYGSNSLCEMEQTFNLLEFKHLTFHILKESPE